MDQATLAATVVLLLCACWTDVRRLEISNLLCAAFASGGLLYQLAAHGLGRLLWSLGGLAAGLLALFALYAVRGLGAGDVKWFAAFGAWGGALAALQLAAYSMLIAGVFAVLLLTMKLPPVRPWALKWRWPWGVHPAQRGRGAKFPFMLAVAPAYALLLWQGI